MTHLARLAVAAAVALAAASSILSPQQALAAYPGANGLIVFSSNRASGGGIHLFTMTEAGGSVTQLTFGNVRDRDPVFSPGGTRVAFTRYSTSSSSTGEIYVMNADGTGLRKLTNNFDHDFAPSFRADGALIAFSSDRMGNYDLFAMNLDGTGVTRITSNTTDDMMPAYFADDLDRVYYSTTTGGPGPNTDRHIRQLVISLHATGDMSLDTSVSRSDTHPDASPFFDPLNNLNVTFERFICGSSGCWTEVQTVGPPLPTTGGPDLERGPAFSPDRGAIWFSSNANDPDPDDGVNVFDIWRMNVDGTGRTRVSSNTSSFSLDPNMQPIPAFPLVDARFDSFDASIQAVVGAGIATGCEAERYCPDSPVARGQMAAFLDRALDLPDATQDYFTDDENTSFEASINRVREAGIAFGCTETTFCPNSTVPRGEMAAFLDRALDLPAATQDYFTDDETSTFEDSINRAREADIAFGCTDTTFCPTATLTRGQMAAFLDRAFVP